MISMKVAPTRSRLRDFKPAFAQPVHGAVQFALRGQALLLGDSADGLQGQRIGSDAWFQAEADRRQGLGGIVTARLLAGECAGSARFR
jgi:hypothetical protein